MKKITIFTPTYNRAYILGEAYKSLLNQTCKEFIWLIVDDGSTDNTKEVVTKWIQENKIEIKYIYQKNAGKYRAVNTGIKNCNTELFSFLDSDDYYREKTIETFLEIWNLVKDNKKIAGIVGRRCDYSGNLIGSQEKYDSGELNFSTFTSLKRFFGDTCRMYKTAILKQNLYPKIEEKFVPENLMFGKIDEKYNVYFLNEALSVSEYLSDGYTTSYKKLLRDNPKGYLLSLNQSIINEKRTIMKFKFMLSYIIWGKKHKYKNIYKDSNNKFLYILSYCFANICLALGIPTWYEPKKGFINKIKIYSNILKYYFYSICGSKAQILDAKETVDFANNMNKSIIRLGDGEFNIINGEDICYQKNSKRLQEEFEEILNYYKDEKCEYILCVPKFFFKCNGLILAQKRAWISNWSFPRYYFKNNFAMENIYGDAFLFAKGNEEIYSKLWEDKNYEHCIFVHNQEKYAKKFEEKYNIKTSFVKICSENAYEYVDEIIDNINSLLNRFGKEKTIVMISAGPAAKIIVYRLSKKVKVIDAGHWFDNPLENGG